MFRLLIILTVALVMAFVAMNSDARSLLIVKPQASILIGSQLTFFEVLQ